MPAFEASFRLRVLADSNLTGNFIKATAGKTQYWTVTGTYQQPHRFIESGGKALQNISGKWNVDITRPNGTIRKAVAIFKQQGSTLTGSFLTPSSDYRYLEGIVSGTL